MTYAVAELQRQMAKLVCIGTVIKADAAAGMVEVDCGDGLETPMIPVVQALAGANGTTYTLPAIGEQVVVLSMAGRLETAFVIGSVYQDKHPNTASDSRVQMLQGADGAKFIYDGQGTLTVSGVSHVNVVASGNCNVTAGGTCVVSAAQATITASNINLNGNVSVSGSLSTGAGVTIGDTLTVTEKARFNKGTSIPADQKYDRDKV